MHRPAELENRRLALTIPWATLRPCRHSETVWGLWQGGTTVSHAYKQTLPLHPGGHEFHSPCPSSYLHNSFYRLFCALQLYYFLISMECTGHRALSEYKIWIVLFPFHSSQSFRFYSEYEQTTAFLLLKKNQDRLGKFSINYLWNKILHKSNLQKWTELFITCNIKDVLCSL